MTSAMILGASGLTGQALLAELIADEHINRIVLLVRKPLAIEHDKIQQHQVDFHDIKQYQELFAVDRVYCCLGSTIKSAGSKVAFRAVDIDLVSRCAQLATKGGAKQFIVISSVGANSSSANFYSRCKGEMENALKSLCATSAMKLTICRPSLLLGKRADLRPAESVAAALSKYLTFIFTGPLKKYRPIRAWQLAKAMRHLGAQETGQQISTLASHELIHLSHNRPQNGD